MTLTKKIDDAVKKLRNEMGRDLTFGEMYVTAMNVECEHVSQRARIVAMSLEAHVA